VQFSVSKDQRQTGVDSTTVKRPSCCETLNFPYLVSIFLPVNARRHVSLYSDQSEMHDFSNMISPPASTGFSRHHCTSSAKFTLECHAYEF
jgi:hypothetical protein